MRILSPNEIHDARCAVTIGVFDGVHRGHQLLLGQLDAIASSGGYERVVVTFDIHPLSVLAPDHAPKMLLSLEQKLRYLEQTGHVDAVVVIPFNAVRAAQSAKDFVEEVIVEQLHAAHVLVGSNFVFGHARRGNPSMLKELGAQYDFDVTPVELLCNEAESPVSSTLIRQYISVGNMTKAHELLTRPHELTGVVVEGDKFGNDLGYPTANTQVSDAMCIPADGVYSGRAHVGGKVYRTALSIGVRPMFHEDNIRVIEPYILDFSEDIYGETLTLEIVDKLRDQLVLESVDALVQQIEKDVELVRSSIEL